MERRTSVRTAVVWDAVQQALAAKSGANIVDLGGGTGGFAVRLAELGHHVTVIDPSPDALAALSRRAQENNVSVAALQGDLDNFAALVAPASYDLVLCHGVLGIVPDPAAGVRALAQALVEGGSLSLLVGQRHAAGLAQRGVEGAGVGIFRAAAGGEHRGQVGAAAALIAAHQERPDVIILDVMMPVMDGYEVLRRLQADEATRTIPVVFVTALHDEDSEQRGFELGAADFIHKPIRAAVALSRIRAQIDARTARESLRRKAQHMARVAEQGAEQLENTRQQLLQSEKMASIGQLSAGIAHEINNPVGFVASNLAALGRYLDDLFSIIDACAAESGAPAEQRLAEVRGLMQRLEYDYLKEDVLDLLAESKEGVERVRQIVADMKGFSHAGASGWQWADLHGGLDSTLNIARSTFKHHCTLVKRYGELPQIHCIPSQLNQVFMNLVVNAAQAIEGSGEITVTTGRVGDDSVQVSIADTGKGISPEGLRRLFEPFYTTKPVGKGTGLGLSISYGIVEQHGGRLSARTAEGGGAEFVLELPQA